MTTVEKVLIYEALERNTQYKEEKKLSKQREKQVITVAKSKPSQKKVLQGVSIGRKDFTYKTDYLKSRGYDVGDYIPCEIPLCGLEAVDIHHISQSMRGVRQHKTDGSDLISLCRDHHNKIHSYNTYDNREILLGLVRNILFSKTIKGR